MVPVLKFEYFEFKYSKFEYFEFKYSKFDFKFECFKYFKFKFFFCALMYSWGILAIRPTYILIWKPDASASVLGPVIWRANLGSGHILPPLWDGVYGERRGWAAADVTAGPT